MVRVVVLAAALGGCGRIAFDHVAGDSGATGDGAVNTGDAISDSSSDAFAPTGLAYVKPFAQRNPGTGASDSFTIQAAKAGNAVLLQVACADSATVAGSVTVAAPGWTFTNVSGISSGSNLNAETLTAIAPNTTAVTLTVTWNIGCNLGTSALGDEFTNVDPVAPFGTGNQAGGTGNCGGSTTTEQDNAAVWCACVVSASVTAIGGGYTKGADNGNGDMTAYKVTTDPAGTLVLVGFTSTTTFISSTYTVNPAP